MRQKVRITARTTAVQFTRTVIIGAINARACKQIRPCYDMLQDSEENLFTSLQENAILSKYLYIIISRLTQYFGYLEANFKIFVHRGTPLD